MQGLIFIILELKHILPQSSNSSSSNQVSIYSRLFQLWCLKGKDEPLFKSTRYFHSYLENSSSIFTGSSNYSDTNIGDQHNSLISSIFCISQHKTTVLQKQDLIFPTFYCMSYKTLCHCAQNKKNANHRICNRGVSLSMFGYYCCYKHLVFQVYLHIYCTLLHALDYPSIHPVWDTQRLFST